MKYFQIIFLLFFSCSLLAETRIDYYVNLGGIKIADANFTIKSDKNNWSLLTEVEAAGIVDVFVKFISTTESKGIINDKIGNELVNVFVPTTPNPTSGFLLMVPKKNLIFLDITFEQASKFIVSAGTSDID